MDSSGVIATKNRAVRVAEIFANGTATNTDVAGMGYDPYYARFDSVSSNNILANATLYSYTGFNIYYASKPLEYFDGNARTEAYISCIGEHPTITYLLRANTEIESFMMYQINDTLRSSYSIYVGDDPDTLYTDANKIYSWDAAVNSAKIQEYYCNSSRKTGKYFGIYFDDVAVNSDNVGIRIAEVFVGGTELNSETYNSTRDTVEARISADNNLLKGRTPTVAMAYVTSNDKYDCSSGNNFAYLTDGSVMKTSHADIYGYGHTYDVFVYSLGGTALVEGFELFNRAAQNTSYEVYLSDSPNGILEGKNKIYSYDGSTDISASYRCQYVYFAAPKTGSYIAVKLLKTYGASTSSNNYRISEIAAYGKVLDANPYEIYSIKGLMLTPKIMF